jgi:hypothetical protein
LSEEIKKEKEDDVLLSPGEVFSVLEFATALSGGNHGYNNLLTPDLVNARLKEMNLNPSAGTREEIERALNNPNESEVQLQEFGQNFEMISQPYKRLISYLANMLSFDLTYSCINAEQGDYTSAKYKKDFKEVAKFFDKFDYKEEFATAVKEMLRNELYTCFPRFGEDRTVLQEFNSSPIYTKVTGRWDWGFLLSVNMYYFILPGISLDGFPPFFKQKYAEFWSGSNGLQKYNPMISPSLRGNSAWVFWQDVPPDVMWGMKMSRELATRTNYFASMYLDLLDQGLMRNLQRNINLSVANRIMVGEVPLLNRATQAGVRDQFSITAKSLGEFLAVVKAALGDSLKTAAVPLTNVQAISFPAVNDLYKESLNTTLATSGINTDLIFTGNTRPNILATNLSLNTDEQLMEGLYPQFEAFLNYHVNKLTKYFKFRFSFQGTKFFNNRQQRFEKQMTLMSNGIVLPNHIAASLGIDPFAFQREMEEARAMGFVDKLTPITPAFQQPGSEKAGRPQKSESDLTESGGESRSNGSNIPRGGKV